MEGGGGTVVGCLNFDYGILGDDKENKQVTEIRVRL